ncbi:MAG: hypothetical protein OXU48_05415 [candidate division Zixibacteria bacterium]|nr:hypothetical protein [candidate division Zixibacteria bacterium]
MFEVPDAFPERAVIWVVPLLTAVTRPLPLTVATAVLLLVQDTVWPVIGLLFWSLTVADNCTVAPIIGRICEEGAMVRLVATGVGGGAGGVGVDGVDGVGLVGPLSPPPHPARIMKYMEAVIMANARLYGRITLNSSRIRTESGSCRSSARDLNTSDLDSLYF